MLSWPEYAGIAIGKLQAAMDFVRDCFQPQRAEFVRRFAAGRKDVTRDGDPDRPPQDPHQARQPRRQAIVAARAKGNHLVLAGPGGQDAGDRASRRLAAAQCMVLPEEIMVLACNRSRRQRDPPPPVGLVDTDAAGVTVQTHMAGHAPHRHQLRGCIERGEQLDFDAVIRQATRQLTAAGQAHGEGAEASVGTSIVRDHACSRACASLLVDRYQDINGEPLQADARRLTGRTLQTEERPRLADGGRRRRPGLSMPSAAPALRYIRSSSANPTTPPAAMRWSNYRSTRHHPTAPTASSAAPAAP